MIVWPTFSLLRRATNTADFATLVIFATLEQELAPNCFAWFDGSYSTRLTTTIKKRFLPFYFPW
jgi:hypothetical protein